MGNFRRVEWEHVFVVEAAQQTVQDIAKRIVYVEASARARMAEWLELVAEFDRRGAATRTGFSSTASWLAFSCDLTERTARDHVRVARRLADMPRVAKAFKRGRLSYAKVRALSRADASEDEAKLLEVAFTSTASRLESYVRQLRSSRSADLDVARRGHARRSVDWFDEEDGSVRFFGRLDAVGGAILKEAVSTMAEQIHAPDPREHQGCCGDLGGRPPLRARRADGLVELLSGGKVETHLVLHADPASLACLATGSEKRKGDVCVLRDGPAIPSEVARRLTCDAMISIDGLNLGRTTRLISPAQRRALEARDGRVCGYPGCNRTHGLAGHHITMWQLGGRTDLDNLILLCPYHHRLFHEGGFRMRRRRNRSLVIWDDKGTEIFTLAPPGVRERARPGPLAAVA
jgi:hypothetical protein